MNEFVGLYLCIGHTYYRLTALSVDTRVVQKAWRVTKKSGKEYTVFQDEFGLHCDCKDFAYRRQRTRKKCKHCQALAQLGLLEDMNVPAAV